MDYRYIHPLYTNDDYESARDYLADNVHHQIHFDGLGDNEPDPKLLKAISRNVVTSLFGVNLIRMANYSVVQQFVVDKYLNSIMNYFKYCGVDARLIEIQYPKFIPYALAHRAQQKDFKPLKQFDPNVEWGSLDYTNNVDLNLVNPLNSMSHYFLDINGITKYNFVKEIAPLYFGNRVDEDILQWEKEKKTIFIKLKILPDDNLYRINKLVKSIHKYF